MTQFDKSFDIENLRIQYEKDPVNKTMEKALFRCHIDQMAVPRDYKIPEVFDIELQTHGIVDQKKSGTCWIHNYLNYLREVFIKASGYAGDFTLSSNYIAYYDKLEKMNFYMNKLIVDKNIKSKKESVKSILIRGIDDGGTFSHLAFIIDKYGLVPSAVYPESATASDTAILNSVLSRLLRKFYDEIKTEDSIEKINLIKSKYILETYTVLTRTYGMPPEIFDFSYKDVNGAVNDIVGLTPQHFYKIISVDVKSSYINVMSTRINNRKYGENYIIKDAVFAEGEEPYKALNVDINRAKRMILRQLKEGMPVCFSTSTLVVNYNGKWVDIYPRFSDIVGADLSFDRNQINDNFDSCASRHGLLITGARTEDGKPVAWKIENSWGPDEGFNGFISMDDDFMTKYFNNATINKAFLTDKEKEMSERKPLVRK